MTQSCNFSHPFCSPFSSPGETMWPRQQEDETMKKIYLEAIRFLLFQF